MEQQIYIQAASADCAQAIDAILYRSGIGQHHLTENASRNGDILRLYILTVTPRVSSNSSYPDKDWAQDDRDWVGQEDAKRYGKPGYEAFLRANQELLPHRITERLVGMLKKLVVEGKAKSVARTASELTQQTALPRSATITTLLIKTDVPAVDCLRPMIAAAAMFPPIAQIAPAA